MQCKNSFQENKFFQVFKFIIGTFHLWTFIVEYYCCKIKISACFIDYIKLYEFNKNNDTTN